MITLRLSRFLKSLYAHATQLSWESVALFAAAHFAVSYAGIQQFETGEVGWAQCV